MEKSQINDQEALIRNSKWLHLAFLNILLEHGFYHAVTGEQVISYMHQHTVGSVIWPQTSVTSELTFSLSRETSKSQVQFWVLPFYSGTAGVSGLCRTVQNKLWVEVQTDLVADAPHISLQGINGFPINRKREIHRADEGIIYLTTALMCRPHVSLSPL